MSRNYGIMSDRQSPRGASVLPAATRDEIHPRDSIPSEFAFPRGNFSQTVIDVAAIVFGALFVTVTGLGIAFSLFVLWFVKI